MFILEKMDVGLTPPIEYQKATAGEDITLGEALVLSSGLLTKCGAAASPEFVAVGTQNDDDMAPVVRVNSYMEFETTLAAAPGSGVTLVPGNKVTLHTDGLQVTATTTSGVAEILRIDGQSVGSLVVVRL